MASVARMVEDGSELTDLPALSVDGSELSPADALVLAEHFTVLHSATEVTHTHQHSAYGVQGGDKTHAHQHTHQGDASHAHHRTTTSVTRVSGDEALAHSLADLEEKFRAAAPDVERTRVKVLTADGSPSVELELPVRWDPEAPQWTLGPNGCPRKVAGNFVLTAAAGPDMPQLVDDPGAAWHAVLCVEGLRTDEDPGREIMPGACRFPDLPVSLRFQVEDEGGHWGAISCGSIQTMERQELSGPNGQQYNAIMGGGAFGTDEIGQKAQLAVAEEVQRFVSIDPRDVEAEVVEVSIDVSVGGYAGLDSDDDDDAVVDWWVRYTDLVIGAATIVATPALQQAVIALASVALPDTPIAVENAPTSTVVVTASGAELDLSRLSSPPAEWFENPGFHVGDPRLVRQPDGKRACPLTVTPEGRVFGHACYWGQEHTASRSIRPGGGKVRPPRSATYAYYMTGYRTCENGERVSVGKITMGTGHAGLSLAHAAAKAHYDGGSGAVQVADVVCGEDDFGVWFAGALCEPWDANVNPDGPTPQQVRQFCSLDISPDWREIAGKLHMIAMLSVPVGGFPVARESLVASGGLVDDAAINLAASARGALNDDGEFRSLVAAGRVQRVSMETRLARAESALDLLLGDLRSREAAASLARLRDLVAGS